MNTSHLSDLLRSPLGILVLARSIVEIQNPSSDVSLLFPTKEIAARLQEMSKGEARTGYFDVLSAKRLSELIVECEFDFTPYSADYQHQVEVLLAYGPVLKPFAERLLEAPATARWFADLDRQRQEWISSTLLAPEASSFHPDLRPVGSGITKPRNAFWTSTAGSKHYSHWIYYLRNGEYRRPPPYYRWRMNVLPIARVYEVHSPQQWYTLCLRYPAPSCLAYEVGVLKARDANKAQVFIEPNWQAVAQDWDGIHLSVGGLLTTERVVWGELGAQTHLFGWDVESTLWLRWVFGNAECLTDVDERT